MLDATRLRVLVAVARHGSVTAAAQALNYAQPSISHHMARLEAETGVKLMERSGRGIRLTEAGRLLAERAEEILGRLDAAEAELAAHVGLRQERVRLAACGSALATLGAAAAAELLADDARLQLHLTEAETATALHMLRAGAVDVAVVCQFLADLSWPDAGMPDGSDPRGQGDLRWRLVLDEPVYLITAVQHRAESQVAGQVASDQAPVSADGLDGAASLARRAECAGQHWIAGDPQHREFLVRLCRSAGFAPEFAASTTDYVAVQALVAAGVGVAILPGLALRAARHPDVAAIELTCARRHVLALTYGDPPDPPATRQLIEALVRAATPSPGPASPPVAKTGRRQPRSPPRPHRHSG